MVQSSLIPTERITRAILLIRGHKVMLDADLAALYGVTTAALVQAVKQNAERFPADFMFQLTAAETMRTVGAERSPTPSRSRAWRCSQASFAARRRSR
jgi:hypothetical protein